MPNKGTIMSYKRVFIPAICIVLAATTLFLGCGSSTPSSDNVTTSFTQEIKDYFGEYYNLMKRSDAMSAWSVGIDYEHKGQYDKAIAKFNKAIELDPEDYLYYMSRADCYLAEGEYDNAIADCNKVIELHPEASWSVYLTRGIAYRSKGEYDNAIVDHSKAIELNAGGAGYYERGRDYQDKGEYDNAIADFTRLIRGRYGLAKSYYYRGCAYRSNGEYENAASDFEKVIELGTSYPELVEGARQALEDIRK